ncbi:MAG: putative toxin-antitoxin system toxin component, PIN family, partial [Spirochaetia bacterium]
MDGKQKYGYHSGDERTHCRADGEEEFGFHLCERVTYPVYPDTNIVDVCRDSRDHIILECALAANAEYIIAGDKDLTVLQKFLGTVIIT